VELSVQHVLDGHTLKSSDCKGGSTNDVWEFILQNQGVLLESKYNPYTAIRFPCKHVEVTCCTVVFL
jgi:hypothetical protein